jgi:hypothetical protein
MEDAANIRCCIYPAALLPYPNGSGVRPVALRPTLSSGLPFSSCKLARKINQQFMQKLYKNLIKNKKNNFSR